MRKIFKMALLLCLCLQTTVAIQGNQLENNNSSTKELSVETDIKKLFNADSGNTWVFTGGANTQGGFSQVETARNFVGHFEEYIRWECVDDNEIGTRERYTINTGKAGQTIEDININYDTVVAQYKPKAVSIFVGIEDYSKGDSGLSLFKENLKSLIDKIEISKAVPIIQTPVPDSNDSVNIKKYLEVIKEVAISDDKIFLVDHFNNFVTEGISYPNGNLDKLGHLKVAQQLMQATTDKYVIFPLDELAETSEKPKPNWHILQKDENTAILDTLLLDNSSKKLNWLFIGDSITHGAAHTYGYDSISQLFEKFIREEKGRKDDVVINTAISGFTTDSFLANIDACYNNYKDISDIAIIMFGTNDCVTLDLDTFKNNLNTIIEQIKQDGILPILRTPNLCVEGSNRNQTIEAFVDIIRNYAEQNNIILVDHYMQWVEAEKEYPYITKPNNWIARNDTIHPGASGQLNMFHALIQRLGLWNEDGAMEKFEYQMPYNNKP